MELSKMVIVKQYLNKSTIKFFEFPPKTTSPYDYTLGSMISITLIKSEIVFYLSY